MINIIQLRQRRQLTDNPLFQFLYFPSIFIYFITFMINQQKLTQRNQNCQPPYVCFSSQSQIDRLSSHTDFHNQLTLHNEELVEQSVSRRLQKFKIGYIQPFHWKNLKKLITFILIIAILFFRMLFHNFIDREFFSEMVSFVFSLIFCLIVQYERRKPNKSLNITIAMNCALGLVCGLSLLYFESLWSFSIYLAAFFVSVKHLLREQSANPVRLFSQLAMNLLFSALVFFSWFSATYKIGSFTSISEFCPSPSKSQICSQFIYTIVAFPIVGVAITFWYVLISITAPQKTVICLYLVLMTILCINFRSQKKIGWANYSNLLEVALVYSYLNCYRKQIALVNIRAQYQRFLKKKKFAEGCPLKIYLISNYLMAFEIGSNRQRQVIPQCLICLSEQPRFVMEKCLHMCYGFSCIETVFEQLKYKCPICRQYNQFIYGIRRHGRKQYEIQEIYAFK